jgi:signal peptidase I
MFSRRLDRRVRAEAASLVKEARGALLHKRDLRGKGGNLLEVTDGVDHALAKGDLAKVRAQLPVLDALIDELVVRKPKAGVAAGVESIAITLALAFGLKFFVLEAFKIPSSSMYPTLEIGDHIFVNKFIYGARVPMSTTKLFDLSAPKRGEVVVFIMPCEPEKDFIKRVVATAGDTVEVRCSTLYVNGQPVPQELVNAEDVYSDNQSGSWQDRRVSRYRETVNGHSYDVFHEPGRPENPALYSGKDFPEFGDLEPPSCTKDARTNPNARPSASQQPGKVVVTRAVDELASKDDPTKLDENHACQLQAHYVVPPGHVFAMGDNRAGSNDSRFWGSVPIDNIKGKAMFIWFSYPEKIFDFGSYRWPRIGNFVE